MGAGRAIGGASEGAGHVGIELAQLALEQRAYVARGPGRSDLRHELHPDPRTNAALAAWRRRLGLGAPPALAVLSRGDVPLDHGALRSGREVVVLTETPAASRLRAAAARLGRDGSVGIEAIEPCDPRTAVAWLRRRFDRVTVELGPSAARELYLEPAVVDALWLGRLLEPAPPEPVIGRALLRDGDLARLLPLVAERVEVVEASGRWGFEHRRAVR